MADLADEIWRDAVGDGKSADRPEGSQPGGEACGCDHDQEITPGQLMSGVNLAIEGSIDALFRSGVVEREQLVHRSYNSQMQDELLAPAGHHLFQLVLEEHGLVDLQVAVEIHKHICKHDHGN